MLHAGDRPPHQRNGRHIPIPAGARDGDHRNRGDDHDAGDRQSIGRGEGRTRTERPDQGGAPDEQQPVDERHVDLTCMGMMRVPHRDPRKQAETDGLQREREGPEISACDAMMVATVASTIIGTKSAWGNETVEELAPGDGRRTQQVGALTEIIEQQGGIDHPNQLVRIARCPKCPRSAYIASPPVTTSISAPRISSAG